MGHISRGIHCVWHTIVGACVFACLCMLNTSVCLRMLHRSREIHCMCVCVTAQATYSADQVSSMSWRCTRSVAKGGDAEMRRWGEEEDLRSERRDEASPQIYVVAVQFVTLSGFSLSGRKADGAMVMSRLSRHQIYLPLSYFTKYLSPGFHILR